MTTTTTVRAVDADGHVVEIGDELARFGWDRASTGNEQVDMMLFRSEPLRQFGLCATARPYDAATRLDDMDREGIAVAVNFPTALLLLNQLDAQVAAELGHAYNNWAYERFTVPSEGRVLTMALVSLGDAGAAIRELRRAVTELGVPGVAVPPYVGHRHLDDPALEPFWALVEELDVPVGIHGGRATTPPLLPMESFRDQRRYYVMAHPFGQMVAMGDLVLGGVLARHPSLRVAFLESGIGWVRWYADRLDEAVESVSDPGAQTAELDEEPSEYVLGGRCYFSCEPDEPGLPALVTALGDDQVLFASDYPHFDCKFPDSVRALERSGLDDAVFAKVTRTNPARFYGLRV